MPLSPYKCHQMAVKILLVMYRYLVTSPAGPKLRANTRRVASPGSHSLKAPCLLPLARRVRALHNNRLGPVVSLSFFSSFFLVVFLFRVTWLRFQSHQLTQRHIIARGRCKVTNTTTASIRIRPQEVTHYWRRIFS